jgi:hypothetical protein
MLTMLMATPRVPGADLDEPQLHDRVVAIEQWVTVPDELAQVPTATESDRPDRDKILVAYAQDMDEGSRLPPTSRGRDRRGTMPSVAHRQGRALSTLYADRKAAHIDHWPPSPAELREL